MGDVAGIDSDRVTRWLRERVELSEPLRFDLVAHGRSNLTFRVSDASGATWILRRPPTGHVLQSAHDMAREHRIISALGPTGFPVPQVVGLCEDADVNGAPFYVMQDVPGTIVRDNATTGKFSPEQRRRMSESLVDTSVRLHAIDPDSIGLGDLGRKEAYVARQLKRWRTQIETGSDRDLPRLKQVHGILEAKMPEQTGAGIVHGDYRLDNCMMADSGDIAAVLDWELCTLGDTMADLGMLVMYWGNWPDFISADEAVRRYGKQSGKDVSNLPYFVAFANWRLACIVEGVRVRFEKGAMGGKSIGTELDFYAQRVDALVETAASALARL
jgi:aminoglycoside phosphotransferase (APT) family kinase protein